jgi:metal-responsive CopG/Arc/MetJ family transcriptional regulator
VIENVKTKSKFTVSIDEEILKEFKEMAKKECLNVSAWIESKVTEYVERRKLNGQQS